MSSSMAFSEFTSYHSGMCQRLIVETH